MAILSVAFFLIQNYTSDMSLTKLNMLAQYWTLRMGMFNTDSYFFINDATGANSISSRYVCADIAEIFK